MDDDDEDLKRAIALSMQESAAPPSQNAAILIEDSDDDLKRAIAMSREAEQKTDTEPIPIDDSETDDDDLDRIVPLPQALVTTNRNLEAPKESQGSISLSTPETQQATPQVLGLAGLDRKQMEQERLARLAARTGKRERDISPPALSRPAKAARMENEQEAVKSTSPPPFTRALKSDKPSAVTSTSPSNLVKLPFSDGSMSYPEGRLFQTWAFRQPRSGNEIKIEEVLERRTLTTALLSAFQIEYEWIFTKLDTKRTQFQFVLHDKDAGQRAARKKELEDLGPNVKACFPNPGAGSMHSKLMLLAHPNKLRVAIPSANLMSFDWGETGTMENTVWVIDLPRLPSPDTPKISTPFLVSLQYFLTKQGLSSSFISSLSAFDWSATSRYAFIHTVGGISWGPEAALTGLPGLSTAVRALGLSCPTASTKIDFAASSIGALTDRQLSLQVLAAAGHLPLSSSVPTIPPLNHANYNLYFPSRAYVCASAGGSANGGTIWLSREHAQRDTFPRDVLREFRAVRPRMLSHAKLLFARGPGTAWVYAGSANVSESAWGTVGVERSGVHKGKVKTTCRNWEAGVLIPVVTPGEGGGGDVPGFEVFDGTIRAFEVPAPKLEGEPWYIQEHLGR